MVHFTVHMDEETPHAHFGFVPLRDGKLSWKGFFPDKAALGAMQDRFYERVGALYGLSRGEKRLEGQPARRHKSVAEYKAESRRVQAELDEKAEQLEAAREELASTGRSSPSAGRRSRVSPRGSSASSRAGADSRVPVGARLPRELQAKLAEFAENPICKAALAAGRDFMTHVTADERRRCSSTVPGRRPWRWRGCRGRWASGLCSMKSGI